MVHWCPEATARNNERPMSTYMQRSTRLGDLCMCTCTYVSILKGEGPRRKWTNDLYCVWHLYGEWMCGDSREIWPFCFGMSPWFWGSYNERVFTYYLCNKKAEINLHVYYHSNLKENLLYTCIHRSVYTYKNAWKETHQCFCCNYKCVMRCKNTFSKFSTFETWNCLIVM